jgi:hypothetical protein
MLARLRPHLTFANVVSLLALRAQLGSWLRSVDTGGLRQAAAALDSLTESAPPATTRESRA